MQTSDLLLRQVRRALVATFLLGGFATLLQFALPLAALHVIDSAIPARSFETLALLALVCTAALATLTCVNAARARILLYGGLWIEHTLGAHFLEHGLHRNAAPDALRDDASAPARLRRAATDGSLLAVLDAPWQIMMIAGLSLIDWRLAAIAAAAATVLFVRLWLSLPKFEHAEARTARAADRTLAWWHGIARAGAQPRTPSAMTTQWERLHREHVGGAYALFSTTAAMSDVARFGRATAQVAVLSAGACLVIDGSITLGALVAAVFLLWRALEPMEKLSAHLPSLTAARSAWINLAARAASEPAARPSVDNQSRDLPRLRIAGPVAVGFAAVVLFFAIGIGVAATTRLGQLAAITGKSIFETQLTAIFPSRKGIGAQVFVAQGAIVAKGDLLATLETRVLDARIAALKLKAATAQIELNTLKQELAAQASALPLKTRAPLEKLEARIVELGRQSRDLIVQIAGAEEELSFSRIVAPAAGRIVSLDVRPGMPVEIDTPLATLVTADTTLLQRLFAPLGIAAFSQKLADKLALTGTSTPDLVKS